ncbi:MAG: ATP-dependent Clp protease adaptor ClpS [Planctomycetota bacterium]
MEDQFSAAATLVRPEVRPSPVHEREEPRLWHVVLHDSNDHSVDYVVEMLNSVFRMPASSGLEIALAVDTKGRAICMTTHRELAELKVDQIRSYGPDHRVAGSVRSMYADLVPAECAEGQSK